MDFFARQDHTRRQSAVLLLVFVMVLLGFALLIHGFVVAVSYLQSGTASLWAVTPSSIALTLLLWSFILLGCLFRYLDVRGGGRRLAERFGAAPLVAGSRQQADRELLDVVAEMAVAASVQVPASYCLRHESAINAFVVGQRDDLALVVSQGALDMLDREELQGVVGHEFAHIVNGDLTYNMRLLVALGGLNALDEIGQNLLAGAGFLNRGQPSVQHRQGAFASIPLLLAGWSLRVIGMLGVFGGSVVRAAFSRQREYLADASSVQFTRNSYALASALDRVDLYAGDRALHSSYRRELAHLCFQVPRRRRWFASVLHTHPPIRDRIRAIDPHFAVKARKQRKPRPEAGRTLKPVAGSATRLSDRFELFASDQLSCMAILFALFVSKDEARAERYFSAIGFAYDRKFKDKVRNVFDVLGDELDINKLRIIEYIAPTLNRMKQSLRRQLLLNIEKLVDVEQEYSLANFSAMQLLRRRLDSEIPVLDKVVGVAAEDGGDSARKPRRRSIEELGKELALLLSLMVEASGQNRQRVLQDYSRVLSCYTSKQYPMRSAAEEGVVAELEQAFYALYHQPLPQRQAFVRHCAEIMLFDGIRMEQEIMLLNLFAASLDVPELAVA